MRKYNIRGKQIIFVHPKILREVWNENVVSFIISCQYFNVSLRKWWDSYLLRQKYRKFCILQIILVN